MKIALSLRAIVRYIIFTIAIFSVLLVFNFITLKREKSTQLKLQYTYTRAVEELASSTDNISTTLSKGIYSGTPEMLATFSTKLLKDASTAKDALSQLPIEDIQTDKINKFLSQVGNYSNSIAKKANEGNGLTVEEYENLAALLDFSKHLSDELWDMEKKVQSGQISLTQVKKSMKSESTKSPGNITEGFESFEEGSDNFPALIYDGPFSDNILAKEPLLLKEYKPVDLATALKKASVCSGIPAEKLVNKDDEAGKMPSYCFETDGVNISITKTGGLISYMLKHRAVDDMKLSINDALSTANAYLLKLGIEGMVTTYYETYNNVCTINFASYKNEVTIYTDLIKVSVAMDNGEIMGIDSRGYIVNHYERNLPTAEVSVQDAQKLISPLLTVQKVNLALIPSEGLNEILTYEFLCESQQGAQVLVYVNALTAQEEQILIIQKTKDGILTV